MELSTEQQIFEQIKKSNKVLILLPEILNTDGLASALALKLWLEKLKKDVIVASSGHVPDVATFLPSANSVLPEISSSKSLIISVDISAKKLEEVSYQTVADKVNIYLKSKDTQFTADDVSFSAEKNSSDLVIALGAKSLEDFGQLYEHHTDLLFETAKINIDNSAANEYFGSINLVDVTATSISEILTGLFQKNEESLIDEDIATCLLAGIIYKTASFQHVKTTPKAFLYASTLVALGGRQQEVIKHIYKTKSLPLLKLWGRALARMKLGQASMAVYSTLGQADFEKAGAGPEELPSVLKEFIDNLNGYNIAAIMAEPTKGQARLIAAVHEQVGVEKLTAALGGKARVLPMSHGSYKFIEQDYPDSPLEKLEADFLHALQALPA